MVCTLLQKVRLNEENLGPAMVGQHVLIVLRFMHVKDPITVFSPRYSTLIKHDKIRILPLDVINTTINQVYMSFMLDIIHIDQTYEP